VTFKTDQKNGHGTSVIVNIASCVHVALFCSAEVNYEDISVEARFKLIITVNSEYKYSLISVSRESHWLLSMCSRFNVIVSLCNFVSVRAINL